ncbi:SulP family inorganic anion transporter [Methylophaga sulfidovorans]|uniref:Sulfate permease, SulP family n=1 Tax=Methylophaga sulfidovorans TaxID=45496 RepID=A0A1I3UAD8_9GAMM|nr:sulfate permease [Methylophaga sulfidovorans]SFJ79875.1 sulfate permease, SulP family [Methylophaga sulfidovorans]
MPINKLKQITSKLPLNKSLVSYDWQTFNSDLFAGIITAILLIPQGMAYALLAGLPVQVGIYTSLLPALMYVLFGTSRVLSVGPVSIAAIMVASALSSPEIKALGSSTQNAMILALEGGLILTIMSAFRMGSLVHFISQPVLSGFTSGAALIILFSQFPNMMGIKIGSCTSITECLNNAQSSLNIFDMGIGLLALATLLLMGAPLSKLLVNLGTQQTIRTGITKSAPLLSVIIGTILVTAYSLDTTHSVEIVGHIPQGLPAIGVGFLSTSYDHFLALLPSAFFISLIAYVESVAIAKVMASIRSEKIDTNQELTALGASNLAASISGGMPVAGGFSRTMVNYSAGAQTQIAMLIAVAVISLVLVSISQSLQSIPKAALASIIIVAVYPLVKLGSVVNVWKQDRSDGISQLITLLGVLILGIEEGIILGVIVTIFCYLRRTGKPHIAVVGRIHDTEHYRNIRRHKVETWDNLLLIRIDENITFANINFISEFIEAESRETDAKNIVLIFSSVSYIDTTAILYLKELINSLKHKGVVLHLAEVKGPVIDKLEKIDFLKDLLPGQVFFQTTDAVKCFAPNINEA